MIQAYEFKHELLDLVHLGENPRPYSAAQFGEPMVYTSVRYSNMGEPLIFMTNGYVLFAADSDGYLYHLTACEEYGCVDPIPFCNECIVGLSDTSYQLFESRGMLDLRNCTRSGKRFDESLRVNDFNIKGSYASQGNLKDIQITYPSKIVASIPWTFYEEVPRFVANCMDLVSGSRQASLQRAGDEKQPIRIFKDLDTWRLHFHVQ